MNPDYQKRIASNGLLRETVGMAGMTLGPAGVNPFLAVGRLLNLGLLRPAGIACRRCEGTDVDVALVTICPKCHSIRPETVLRRCPQRGCNYDYLARAAGASLWDDSAPQPAPAVEAPSVCEDVPAGWYPDPSGRHRLRWFHDEWTAWAADAGGPIEDPLNPTVSAAVR